ncbi:hypothetical protein [Kitasatospora sp. HPMI-4]|uniref:hypothetical protein n=1 Tax=Kitasatospora sp. HPMI-4 TaxID=3448443 RepID=UPI003F1B45F3
MTATADAPDPASDEDRWCHIQDRLVQVRARVQEEMRAAIASIDAALAELDTLRRHLADHP